MYKALVKTLNTNVNLKKLYNLNNNVMEFNFRIKDLEVKSCRKLLTSDGEHNLAEIIKWDTDTDKKEYCLVLAYWNKGNEGYNLQFVNGRPFDVDSELFMKLAKQGQQILDNIY